MGFMEFFATQKYDLGLLLIVVLWLVWYITRNKDKLHIQPVLKFARIHIVDMYLVKTGWGLKLMDSWANKYREWVKLFGYVSMGLGFIGIVVNFFLIGFMIKTLFAAPQTTQVGLVLPFTSIPGLGYLSFTHWIIAIFILAGIHEFAHGVVARAHNVKVTNSGFAVLNIFKIPLIPAAFVEPDEKKFPKESDVVQYSVLTAGPLSNVFLSIVILLIMMFVLTPISNSITEPVGFSFAGINETLPAGIAGLEAGMIYDRYNGESVTDAQTLLLDLSYKKEPGDVVTIGYTDSETSEVIDITVTTTSSPDDDTRAFLGVLGVTNEFAFIEAAKPYKGIFNWVRELFFWMFIFNLSIGLINLMPLYITDGGQITRVLLLKLYKEKKAMKLYHIICSFCLYVLLAALFIPFLLGFF
ncbi:MAG: membrane-associated protease RseP (regulator of RpoE activity) [Candidatus Woesearchaeota archaeon]|jgi:membrane-associated protease RseP (regulator of RpoE activity)